MQLSKETGLTTKHIKIWIMRQQLKIKNNLEGPEIGSQLKNMIILKKHFEHDTHPSPENIEDLALLTKLPKQKVSQWFAHQRFQASKRKIFNKEKVKSNLQLQKVPNL